MIRMGTGAGSTAQPQLNPITSLQGIHKAQPHRLQPLFSNLEVWEGVRGVGRWQNLSKAALMGQDRVAVKERYRLGPSQGVNAKLRERMCSTTAPGREKREDLAFVCICRLP